MIFCGEEIARATRGELVIDAPAGPVGTDTRRLQPGMWFLALSGDRFDGHDFLPLAAAAGCAGVIARHVPQGWSTGFVRVADPLLALQDLARYARDGFLGPVIGITGSAGKTTTRALVALAVEAPGPVHQTEGNLNNHVGVPLTILRAPAEAAAWVIEMGMNHLGEIHVLQDIARPTVRLITNVGAAHLEGVGSLEGVAQAKGELFAGARPGDVCCVNMDDARVAGLPIPEGVRVLRYGSSPGCDVRLTDAVVDPVELVTRFRVEVGEKAVLGVIKTPGLHLAHNATAAVAVAVALRLPLEGLGRRLGRYEPVGMRMRIEAGPGGLRVINDAYNANPISMAASLRTLAAIQGARRVALLGDMLELGAAEEEAHREALSLALSLGLDGLGVAGPRFSAAAAALGVAVPAASDAESLAALVGPALQPGDVVLLKGSRGMAMERILQALGGTAPGPGAH